MNNISILIVEDEGIVAYDLAVNVQQMGFAVVGTTATGEEAIQLARRYRPTLILMDVQLGGAMDGIAAAQQIHNELNLPILFLTANSDLGSDERMRSAGSVGRILKPFDKHDVRIQIEKALCASAVKEME
jgi:two-component system, cell cycle sensor histidine kinase and response regulator CckA